MFYIINIIKYNLTFISHNYFYIMCLVGKYIFALKKGIKTPRSSTVRSGNSLLGASSPIKHSGGGIMAKRLERYSAVKVSLA